MEKVFQLIARRGTSELVIGSHDHADEVMVLMARELINIRSSDIIIVAGGRSGTLGEFAIAYEEGKLIGVLTGTGGITPALPELETTLDKNTGAEVIYDDDPEQFVWRHLERYLSGSYVCPFRPSDCCETKTEVS